MRKKRSGNSESEIIRVVVISRPCNHHRWANYAPNKLSRTSNEFLVTFVGFLIFLISQLHVDISDSDVKVSFIVAGHFMSRGPNVWKALLTMYDKS